MLSQFNHSTYPRLPQPSLPHVLPRDAPADASLDKSKHSSHFPKPNHPRSFTGKKRLIYALPIIRKTTTTSQAPSYNEQRRSLRRSFMNDGECHIRSFSPLC